ncbi:ATP-grasp domain-containing protein [Streptomyces sp. NPDC006798]|uniref:D-alanine--D-alanine ligase family protein n=1 Tax=Streptomyces sp. NPDC006798 TaxID=3155462 RepID=UPI0033EEADEF
MLPIEALSPGEFAAPLAVVTGGWSRERERALLSGTTASDALTALGIEHRVLDLAETDKLAAGLEGAELALLAIAGRGAEDGRLQGLLETSGVPYTGSGVFASAVGMNKTVAKTLATDAGVFTPAGTPVLTGTDPDRDAEARGIAEAFGLPVIVKPVSEGGSIGLVLARTEKELADALRAADGVAMMVEEYIEGRSVSAGVLEDSDGTLHVLPPLETATADGIYSAEAKHRPDLTTYLCPARLPDAVLAELDDMARRAHRALHCHGYSRHDFVVPDSGIPVWLEVNTLPGLSRTGNLARMADAAGLSYEQLLSHIVRTARTDRRARP